MADVRFGPSADGYLATYIDYQLEFAIERLRWERDELFGHLSVTCALAGARTVNGFSVSAATFNFSSLRARKERAKDLAERLRVKERIDFIGIVEEVSQLTITAERRGQPAVSLRTIARPAPDTEFDIEGFRFPKQHPTTVFGDGGTCKTLIALHAAGTLAQRGQRVALFDWELDAGTHRQRLEQLFGAQMPDVKYVRCDRPLVYEVDRLKRVVHDERLDLGIFDSVGFACPGPPEAAEHAMSYFRAVRQLGIGSLHIAHVRQGEGNDQRPFGSAFWHNAARSTWFVRLAEDAPASAHRSRICVGLFNRKNNLHALRPAVGFEIIFDTDRTQITRVNVTDVQDLAEALPLWQRMKQAVSHEPKTLVALADELGAKVETLERTARRSRHLFTRVTGADGIHRIALVARGA